MNDVDIRDEFILFLLPNGEISSEKKLLGYDMQTI